MYTCFLEDASFFASSNDMQERQPERYDMQDTQMQQAKNRGCTKPALALSTLKVFTASAIKNMSIVNFAEILLVIL